MKSDLELILKKIDLFSSNRKNTKETIIKGIHIPIGAIIERGNMVKLKKSKQKFCIFSFFKSDILLECIIITFIGFYKIKRFFPIF